MTARVIITIFLVVWFLIIPDSSKAHPLGNFSISHYSGIRVSKDAIEVRYIIDMAEIPTFQELQEAGIAPKTDDPSVQSYLTRKTESLSEGLLSEVNGRRLPLLAESKEIIFPPGAGGLPTMKIGVLYKAKLTRNSASGDPLLLNYRDGNFAGRAGWKEIIAVEGQGVRFTSSSVPRANRSSQLSDYPTDLLNSPPQDLEARVSFTFIPVSVLVTSAENPLPKSTDVAPRIEAVNIERKSADAQPLSNETSAVRETRWVPAEVGTSMDANSQRSIDDRSIQLTAKSQTTPRNSFTELMATKQLGLGLILIALAVAVGLGAFHALEPGHGKTLVAAYLVGSRGTIKHALLLGLIVTAAHTAGVYLLGAVTLYASQYIVPERLYPWLGVLSGVMITGLGLVLLVRRYLSKDGLLSDHHQHYGHHHSHAPHHHHDHAHDHEHGEHPHHHGHSHHPHDVNRQASMRELLTLGISGGIVPCPAALVVLLSAVSMQRIGFGLVLIVAFSVGLAAVLIAIGLLMVYARQFMSCFHTNGRFFTRWLPLASSTIITLFGLGLVIQAVASTRYFSS